MLRWNLKAGRLVQGQMSNEMKEIQRVPGGWRSYIDGSVIPGPMLGSEWWRQEVDIRAAEAARRTVWQWSRVERLKEPGNNGDNDVYIHGGVEQCWPNDNKPELCC